MRLLILAHANRTAGPKYVATNLIRALANLGPGVRVTAVMPAGCGYEPLAKASDVTAVWFDQRGSRARRLVFDAVVLPRVARRIRPDAILALGNVGLHQPAVPQALLVHDPHFVYARQHHGPMTVMERLRYFIQRRELRLCFGRSPLIYSQTPLMLERIRSTFGEHQGLKLLPNCAKTQAMAGGDDSGAIPAPLQARAEAFRLICLCQYYAHKNIEILCDVFERFRDALQGVVVFLTIGANQHAHAGALLRRIERSGLSDRIVNLGPIAEDRISDYLHNCEGLLLPTKMESFSAVYLDAMQCDLPILTSDLDFAREVCGEAACYFDPDSPQSIAESIVRMKGDRSLRRQLVEAGKARLRQVHSRSWAEIASQVVADLQVCMRSPTGERRACQPPSQ